MNVNFYLKNTVKEHTSVEAVVRYKGKRFKIATGISVESKFWDKSEHRVSQKKEYPDYELKNLQIEEVEAKIKEVFITAIL